MKIEKISAPSVNQPPTAKVAFSDGRSRAIAALESQMKANDGQLPPETKTFQSHPVQNPSSVSPEEMSALRTIGQNNQVEENKSSPDANVPKADTKAEISEEPLSSHYANLARKERALRAKIASQEAAIKAREAEIIAREEAVKAKDAEYSTKYIPKERLTNDTLNALLDAGLTYDQITEAMLTQQSQPDFSKSRAYQEMKAQLDEMKANQEKSQKSFEEQQTNAYKQAVSQIRQDTSKLVYTDPNFETIKATNSVGDVVDLIERTFKQDGVLLSVEEAAQAVEDHLVEEAMKITKLKKIQQRMQSASGNPQTTKTTEAPKQQQLKTLSNSVSSTRQLNARERALLAFKGELK